MKVFALIKRQKQIYCEKPNNKKQKNYRTHAIITRGLFTFCQFFEVHLCTVTFGFMYG